MRGRSVFLSIPFLIVMNVLTSLVGLIIYAHYADIGCDPLQSGLISNSNQVCCIHICISLNTYDSFKKNTNLSYGGL